MSNMFVKSYRATSAAIAGYLIVKAVAGGKVSAAGANTDSLLGTADSMGCDADGLLDVALVATSQVRLGGTVVFGDPLTSDGNGKAIKALPANSTQVRIIGFAHADGVADDIIPYHIAPGCLSKASA